MPDIRKMWRFYVKYSDGLICIKIIKLCLIGVVLHIPYNKLRRRFYGFITRVLPKWITVLKGYTIVVVYPIEVCNTNGMDVY